MEFTKRIILILVTVILVQTANAQLRKVETHEDVKIFNAVLLQKTIIESDKTEYYSFFIPQEEDHGSYIVLFLGSKEEMLMNLQDLLTALRTATKGEVYEFHCMEENYTLTLGAVMGEKYFRVQDGISSGRLYESVLKSFLKYLNSNL